MSFSGGPFLRYYIDKYKKAFIELFFLIFSSPLLSFIARYLSWENVVGE